MAFLTPTEGGGGGDFLPIIKYDARAGRIFRVDWTESGKTPVDITRTFKAVFDFENVEVGWIMIPTTGAPNFVMVPFGSPMPAKPSSNHKQGVRLRVKLAQTCGGDLRELAGTANVFLRGINAVHDEYLKLAPANPGKLPVIVLEDTTPVESTNAKGKTTNYQPQWAIAGWAPRPADMPGTDASKYGPRETPPPKTNGAANARTNDEMVAPATKAPAMADDFG